MPLEFDTHYDCIQQGYLKASQAIENIGTDLVNKQKLAVKFECKELKPKGEPT